MQRDDLWEAYDDFKLTKNPWFIQKYFNVVKVKFHSM